jgi:hypothetical protein
MPYGQGILPDGVNNENSSQGLRNAHTIRVNEVGRKINEYWFKVSIMLESAIQFITCAALKC